MTGSWERFGPRSGEVPQTALDDRFRPGLGVPATLRPVSDEGAVQRAIFDPALKQFPNAYRAADPRFADEHTGRAWYAARRAAMDLVIAAIANSPWSEALVLRGSVLLAAWFGDAAREPGDLDFVVVPADWGIDEPRTETMLQGIADAAQTVSHDSGAAVRFDAAGAVSEDIWTYERVPGRRLVLPWTSPGLPGGIIQLDFVFNEHLPLDPVPAQIPSRSGSPDAQLNAATAELSLAWKLMWLLCDRYPQGKDLYDAVLLAEHCTLRHEAFQAVLLEVDPRDAMHPFGLEHVSALRESVEWDHFVTEYPEITESADHYVDRLVEALAPTFEPVGPPADSAYERYARWLAPWVHRYRELLEREGMHAVQAGLAEAGTPPVAAVVITLELLGRDEFSVDDAQALVTGDPAWASLIEIYRRYPDAFEEEFGQLRSAGGQ
ncbi:hypothetical protein C7C46_01615 [Streptomyces tateyamensis]|uniref:Nucleotidyl transferase AbiEii/AbiGii toxin family protein n=1 Tax=Streptomyces tateyamensis TaxID=565073 RepID=A0A2V4PAU6_9ACTN|nr:nucleotidyl transferase AbiEii/AbiGii toxin family protein [Streptomyces tateyamensis]PYC88076.1 hypothetical protein C7C46_01615 [Streptomyces tateyamensis]